MSLKIHARQLPERWTKKKFGEICENLDSKRVPITKSSRKSGNVPYYGASGIVDYVADYIFDENLLLVSEDGANLLARTYPIAFSITGKTWVNNHAHVLRFSEKTTQSFVEYYLNSISLEPYINGMAQPKLNQRSLNSITIPIPPLPEQKRIVSIADQAFEGIDRAIANTKKNLANARELFESHLNAVFTQKGDGWVEKKLGDITELIDSLHKTPSYIDEGGFPMVRVTDIKDGVLNLNNARRVDEATFIEFSKRHIPKIGDIVFSRVGSYGVPALVQSDEVFCPRQNTVFIVPQINCQFLYFFLGSPNSQEQIEKFVAGTTQRTISLKSIKQIQVPIPPSSEQLNLAAKLSSVLIETQRLEAIYQQKLAALNELKQSILQKAFTGELTADTVNQTTKKAEEAIAA